MPKHNKNIAYKDPINLSAAEENSERLLQEVEAENLEFYERNAVIALNTSTIQSGVRLKAGRVIGDPAMLREKIVEERVQSDLYRAVAGNEAVETGKGVDTKNYENSINARFLEGGKVKKGSRLLHKVKNAVLDVVGKRDFVKEEQEERFGKSTKIEDQKKFVAERHREFLLDMSVLDPVMYNNLLNILGLPVATASLDDVIDILSKLSGLALRTLQDHCINNNIELAERPEFQDLLMLADIRQRALSKFGMMEVYNLPKLRAFWSTLTKPTATANQQALASKVEKLLKPNSLIAMEKNPESAALVAHIRARFVQLARTMTPDQAAIEIKDLLDEIEADELPKTVIAPATAGAAPTAGPAEPVSAFLLLQRLLRRDYCTRRKLDPKNFSLEADNFSAVQAALRVADIKKNIDMFRSSNDKAAELALGKVEKGPSTNEILADIIKNHTEFKIFAGVNKYTTRREIRQIMNATGTEVAEPVLERLIAVLQEALSRYKKGPRREGTDFAAQDWDLEELVLVLQTLKAEQWSKKVMAEAADDPNTNMQEKLIETMQRLRVEEQETADEILADVTSPDAIWKVMAVKNELKKVLNKAALQGRVEFNKGIIEAKKLQISKLASGDPRKEVMEDEIKELERNDKEAVDLSDRVTAARKHIKEKNLSGKAKDAYIQVIGLAGVWDKMGATFWWEDKKESMGKWWEGKKESVGKWWDERKKRKAAEKANESKIDSKAWSIFKRAVSPVTGLAEVGYDVGSFIPRMIFRGASGALRMPKRLVGTVSDSAMHSYLTDRLIALSEEVNEIDEDISRLNEKLARAPYGWDSRRINKKINSLNLAKAKLSSKIAALHTKAAERKLPAITGVTGGGSSTKKP